MAVPGNPSHHHVSQRGPLEGGAQVGSETGVPVLSLSKVYISSTPFPPQDSQLEGKLSSSSVVVYVLEAEYHGACGVKAPTFKCRLHHLAAV